MTIYINHNSKNVKTILNWIEVNYSIWLEKAKKVYEEKDCHSDGWHYNAAIKCSTATKNLKYWGLLDSSISATLKYNGKKLYISVKEESEEKE